MPTAGLNAVLVAVELVIESGALSASIFQSTERVNDFASPLNIYLLSRV